ncbi:MAG: hypothetical protein UHD09_06230 [Bifidobacterium sp.]|nr:hypothetical protein [Bifidobacterium sp.]
MDHGAWNDGVVCWDGWRARGGWTREDMLAELRREYDGKLDSQQRAAILSLPEPTLLECLFSVMGTDPEGGDDLYGLDREQLDWLISIDSQFQPTYELVYQATLGGRHHTRVESFPSKRERAVYHREHTDGLAGDGWTLTATRVRIVD